jgi:hypothetical protein
MYRSDRYFGKNDGEHNFFGEEEYIEVEEGVVRLDLKKTGSSPEQAPKSKEEDSGGG